MAKVQPPKRAKPPRLWALLFPSGRMFCPYTSKARAVQVQRLKPELELVEYEMTESAK